MRRLLRPVWVLLALLFLVEAWLWDHLSPVVARIVGVIPWQGLKSWLAESIRHLPPWATLIVFVVPFIALLPLKFLEVYLLATHNWIGAAVLIIAAKLIGVGVTAFIFDVTRDKLLQMAWFRTLYEWMLRVRDWAHVMTEPARAQIKTWMAYVRGEGGGRFMRRLSRLRSRASRRPVRLR